MNVLNLMEIHGYSLHIAHGVSIIPCATCKLHLHGISSPLCEQSLNTHVFTNPLANYKTVSILDLSLEKSMAMEKGLMHFARAPFLFKSIKTF